MRVGVACERHLKIARYNGGTKTKEERKTGLAGSEF
jgi:hypothetical protein